MKKDFIESSFNANKQFFESYLERLTGRYDDFLESHILNSKIYSINLNNKNCGFFGIYNNSMLTIFYIMKDYFQYAQEILKEIIEKYKIKDAFVPTCDGEFLALCMDMHKKVHLQAYFFEDSERIVTPPKYPRENLKLATKEEIDEIIEITGDFVDNHEKRIEKEQLYILRDGNIFLGLGIIVDNIIMKKCKGTGMFTNSKFRNQGVGRSIILHLKEICLERGFIPVPGCWYYNDASKQTLESAGYISRIRLLKIEF